MYNLFLRIILIALLAHVYTAGRAQNGDLKDWSRNSLHAKHPGDGGAKFVKDDQFGQVLSLAGSSDDFVSIPGEALNDLESLSVSGWIYLRTDRPGQRFFDFGQDATR